MSVSPSVLNIYNVFVAEIINKTISLAISFPTKRLDEEKIIKEKGLLDSGAGGEFINQNYARQKNLEIKTLPRPIAAFNVDGTKNKTGTITKYVDLDLDIGSRTMNTRLLVTGLGKQRIILGFPWLQKHNPLINWETGSFEWRHTPGETNIRKITESSEVTKKLLEIHTDNLKLDNTENTMKETIPKSPKPAIIEEEDS